MAQLLKEASRATARSGAFAPAIDQPLVNQYFETINEIEDILVERCCVVSQMKDEVCKLTNYHWLENTCCLHTF